MKEHTIQQCVKILFKDWDNNKSHERYHYAFAIKKNKIIAIGKNQTLYPSTKIYELARIYNISKWLTYPYPHAESDLVTKLPDDVKIKDLEILSIRINRHGQFRLAKPCVWCQQLLDGIGIQKISWSCNHSEYWGKELILQRQHKIKIKTETHPINNACAHFMNMSKTEMNPFSMNTSSIA
jgi:hypothetical protein